MAELELTSLCHDPCHWRGRNGQPKPGLQPGYQCYPQEQEP